MRVSRLNLNDNRTNENKPIIIGPIQGKRVKKIITNSYLKKICEKNDRDSYKLIM